MLNLTKFSVNKAEGCPIATQDVEKILEKYNLSWEFNDLISYCSINIKNERSKKRIKGIFNSLVTVKSGEINTEKGFSKLESIKKVNDIFNYE
jgi:hypothetical protein